MIRVELHDGDAEDLRATSLTFEDGQVVVWHGQTVVARHAQDDVAAVKVIEPGQDDVIEAIRASHANAWAPWTDELDEALLEAADSGRSIDQMAEIFGRKPNAIIQRLKKVRYG